MVVDRRTLKRFVARHRRGTAALCAGVAVLCLGLALRPPSIPTVAVTVADRVLLTGHRLQAGDLRSVAVATSLAPDTAGVPPDQLVGRVLAAPVTAGEPVIEARLVRPDATSWAGPPGTDPVPVRFADAGAVELIDAGHRIDVLAATGAELGETQPQARVVAAGVLVLAVVRVGEEGGDPLMGTDTGASAGRSDIVVLAVTPQEALALAAAEAGARLTFAIVGARAPATD